MNFRENCKDASTVNELLVEDIETGDMWKIWDGFTNR